MDWKKTLRPSKYKLILMIPNIPIAIGLGTLFSMLLGIIIPPLQNMNFLILWGISSLGIDYLLGAYMYRDYIYASNKKRFVIRTIVIYALFYIIMLAGFILTELKYH